MMVTFKFTLGKFESFWFMVTRNFGLDLRFWTGYTSRENIIAFVPPILHLDRCLPTGQTCHFHWVSWLNHDVTSNLWCANYSDKRNQLCCVKIPVNYSVSWTRGIPKLQIPLYKLLIQINSKWYLTSMKFSDLSFDKGFINIYFYSQLGGGPIQT